MSYRRWEEKYVPSMSDPNGWSAIGTSPFSSAHVIKIGDTLYAFGGLDIGLSADSQKIWSTPWNNPTGWTYTGSSFSGLHSESVVGVIGDTIYSWGKRTATAIWSAPVSSPLSWTNTGSTWAAAKDYCALIITPSYLCMYGGYSGSGSSNNVSYASVSNPTSFNTVAANVNDFNGWEVSGCYLDGDMIYLIGGYLYETRLLSALVRTPNSVLFSKTSIGYSVAKAPAIFHVGNYLWTTGNNNNYLYFNNLDQPSRLWKTSTPLPASVQYIYGAQWIGPDGYACMISSNGNIYRSGRRKIYVIDPPLPNGIYSHRRAIYADTGERTVYTVQCQMGMNPWFTNRRDRF